MTISIRAEGLVSRAFWEQKNRMAVGRRRIGAFAKRIGEKAGVGLTLKGHLVDPSGKQRLPQYNVGSESVLYPDMLELVIRSRIATDRELQLSIEETSGISQRCVRCGLVTI